MESSFTDAEKRFVLAEIIKVSHLDVNTLVDFVRSYNVEPDWLSMQLPGGRNMNQVIRAYETMFQLQVHHPPIPLPHLKRKSFDDLSEPVPKRLATSPIEQQPPVLQAPQPLPPPSAMSFTRNVNIQPRPVPHNGYQTLAPIVASPPVASSGGSVRKRGRPSKAEKEARANASTGYVPVAPMPSQTPQPTFHASSHPPPPVPSPPEQNPSVPPPPPGTAAAAAGGPPPYQATMSSYAPPRGGAGGGGGGASGWALGRSPAAGASAGLEDGGGIKGGIVRWRPITSPSDYPAMDKRGSRTVSDSAVAAAQRAPPRKARSVERSERSPSVSNLISPPEHESEYSTTARAAMASRYGPPAAPAAAAGHGVCGGPGGSDQAQPGDAHIKHENSGHHHNTHAPVSNPA